MKQMYNIIYGITYHSVCTSRWCGVPCTPFSQRQRQVFYQTHRPHHKNVHSPQPDNCNYKYNIIIHLPWCNWNTERWKVPNFIQEEDISQLHMPTTQIGGHVELAKPNILSLRMSANLSAKAMKEWRNLLFSKSLSKGSFISISTAITLGKSSPLSGMPKAWPIVSNSWASLLLKLIWDSKGWDGDIEKKVSTRMLAWAEKQPWACKK